LQQFNCIGNKETKYKFYKKIKKNNNSNNFVESYFDECHICTNRFVFLSFNVMQCIPMLNIFNLCCCFLLIKDKFVFCFLLSIFKSNTYLTSVIMNRNISWTLYFYSLSDRYIQWYIFCRWSLVNIFIKERKYIQYPLGVLFLPSFELVNCKRRSKSAFAFHNSKQNAWKQ
jgi:hypothetical protein